MNRRIPNCGDRPLSHSDTPRAKASRYMTPRTVMLARPLTEVEAAADVVRGVFHAE